MMKKNNRRARIGFTLVELMVVILIVGILAGLLLPAINQARMAAVETAYKLEVESIAEAVEKYRNKYGDYPPDGSSWQIMERHLRKAFPQILQSELDLLSPLPAAAAVQGWSGNPWTRNASFVAMTRNDFDMRALPFVGTDLKVMDPAEALVFFLGGFSSNPQRPFTGEGGPFVIATIPGRSAALPPAYQYNVQRSNPSFEFKVDRLTLDQVDAAGMPPPPPPATVTVYNISTDEEQYFGTPTGKDLLPVYLSRNLQGQSAPFVYFDARTYVVVKGGVLYCNFYQPSNTAVTTPSPSDLKLGAIRPLVSETVRTPVVPIAVRTDYDWIRVNLFMDENKFQVMGAGVDDQFGGRLVQEITFANQNDVAASYWTLPSGDSYKIGRTGGAHTTPTISYTRLLPVPSHSLYQRSRGIADNSASCSERTFMTSLKVPGT